MVHHQLLKICVIFSIQLLFLNILSAEESRFEVRSSGEFEAITYNVAGLPEAISGSNPVKNVRLMAEKLNDYGLVFLQEDFWYHQHFLDRVKLPYNVSPDNSGTLGNGLSQFSKIPILSSQSVAWEECSGVFDHDSDCLTPKGFSFSRFSLSEDVELHVYNVHMDAGNTQDDLTARIQQIKQLVTFMKEHSKDQAVIIGGDFNFHLENRNSPDVLAFQTLLKQTNLKDVCYLLHCEPQKLDRFLFRSSERVYLKALEWNLATQFKDSEGDDLSDHVPVTVRFQYQVYPLEEAPPYSLQASLEIK